MTNSVPKLLQPVVLVENLRKQFTRPQMKGKQKQMVAVKNLSFKVMPGEVLGLLGPNGAGKSTTLNMLTAELTPDAGAVSRNSFAQFFPTSMAFGHNLVLSAG